MNEQEALTTIIKRLEFITQETELLLLEVKQYKLRNKANQTSAQKI